jgi:U2-associated protein SR140
MVDKKIVEFPDVENKLQAPSKKSVFEQQKEAERKKRLQEEAETAAVYEDFVKSFDDDGGDSNDFSRSRQDGGYGGFGAPGGTPRRHFGGGPPTGPSFGRGGLNARGRGLASGPGSLGPPPPSLARKRQHEGFQPSSRHDRRDNDRGLLAFEDYDKGNSARKAFNTSDDEDEETSEKRAAEPALAKPTLRLASLPPGTSPAVIKALLPSNLTVDAVRVIPPAASNGERKSMSAIVTLSKDTPANEIDAAVSSLQNRYLGYGYRLSLHRHLSSAALTSASVVTSVSSNMSTTPFGAKAVIIEPVGPIGHGGRYAPPTSYAPTGPGQLARNGPLMHVPVQPPRDIKELKMIHKTLELLIKHGPEFEALLMSRPEVQREEKWAWIWDARSPGGVWYRWRLWEILTESQTKRGQGRYLPVFEGSAAWKAPDLPLEFEHVTRIDEFVSDSDYNSSDEDDSGDEGVGRRHRGRGDAPEPPGLTNEEETAYLNPLQKAKLTHLLARLPTGTGKLRKGDVARITAFAISHAGRGADEVVSAIVSNIEKPFAYTSANPDRRKEKDPQNGDDGSRSPAAAADDEEKEDTSSASLIGLYIVSDILSSSSTSGVRHAWRYRQLIESAFKQSRTFEKLGMLEKRMNWGRLRAEKWKRSVSNVLGLWESWCVFPQGSQEQFVDSFNNPPALREEEEKKRLEEAELKAKAKSKWKAVEASSATQAPEPTAEEEDVDGEPMSDVGGNVDGEPMSEDDDVDVDGEPMEEDGYLRVDGDPMQQDDDGPVHSHENETSDQATGKEPIIAMPAGPTRRQRPKAVDMFADSGSDDD